MLKHLELRNCFTHKRLDLDFEKGLTAILGLNGSGKSLIVEMVQYALWGSSALRGKAEDYKGLQVTLTFEVKTQEYTVRRNGSTVKLTRADKIEGWVDLASGTKAVNPYIQSLFGYSYDVFTMANAINQGKIDELGDMLPTARKKLVDQTIGLDRVDVVGEWVAEKAKDLRAQIGAAERYLLSPVPPPPCAVLWALQDIEARLGLARIDLQVYLTLKSEANVVLVEPQEVLGDVSALEASQSTRQTLLGQQRAISRALAGFPELGAKPEPHPQAGKREELAKDTALFKESMTQKTQIEGMLSNMPAATATQEWVDAAEAANLLGERYEAKKKLLKKLAEYVCPKCDHHWHDEDPRLKDYADVDETVVPLFTPAFTIAAAKRALAHVETRKGLVEALGLLQERLQGKSDHSTVIKEIDKAASATLVYQEQLQQQDRKHALEKELAAIVIPEDQGELLLSLRQYLNLKEKYDAAKCARDEAVVALAKMPENLQALVEDLEAKRAVRSVYETLWKAYTEAQARYDAQLLEMQKDLAELAQWDLCKQAIATLRQRVKGYLLPSLNKVASGLLQTMTAGKLSWIVVSEDFEITVDGQRLETLSGAGKSVANLALRIGLGQVLTNRVFSVLLLDEIDASCDDERAMAIAESLQRLTGQIGQIIQVSHKSGLAADHYVRL
jgi:DNA repair exonuclease SbcCD ATPase subunit